jgi:thiamine pyrophosphate-dependent acetolactate synthase large subunit-like protein
VIIAGQGILYAEAWGELLALAELTDTPVISTLNGKSCFPENHPLSIGCAGGARPDGVNRFLETADVYLGLGTSFTTSDYITPFPIGHRKFLQLTNWEGDISKDYPIDLAIIGDAKPSIGAMIAAVKRKTAGSGVQRPDVIRRAAEEKKAFLDKWMPLLTSNEEPISPYRVVWDLMHTVDRTKTVLTHDAGSPRDQITPFFGVRCKLGTLTIVLKNSIMAGYTKHHPNAAQKYHIQDLGGDYTAMAKAFGGYGERVEKVGEIVPAIKRALEQNSMGIPALLEIITKEETRMAKNLPAGAGQVKQV